MAETEEERRSPKAQKDLAGATELAKAQKEIKRLEKILRRIAKVTTNHEVVKDSAVIYPSTLGDILKDWKTNWWK